METPAKKSIYDKEFIPFLTQILESEKGETQDFKTFDQSLWQFLCKLKWNEKVRLSNQLTGEYMTKTNIGNIRLQIYNDLGINFMIN